MKKKATRATAFKFLRANSIAVLATVSAHGLLCTTPINFIVTEGRRLRFVTKDGTIKYKDIVNGGTVACSVVSYKQMTSVNIVGKAEIIDDISEMNKTLRQVGNMYNEDEYPPILKINRGNLVVIEIIPEKMQYTNFSVCAEELTDHIYNL